jgi:hypothetical protein
VFGIFEVTVSADGAKPLAGQTSVQLQCPGGQAAVCGGVCNSLLVDPLNCGECGRTCRLDGSGELGMCVVEACIFPLVPAPQPEACQAICRGVSLDARLLDSRARCSYEDDGQPSEESGGSIGIVKQSLNGTISFQTYLYSWLPPELTTAQGTWVDQNCCCGESTN